MGQSLLDVHGLADMRQETPDPVELRGRPAVSVYRVIDLPHDARAVEPFKPHVDPVPGMGEGPQRVVCLRGFRSSSV